MKQIEKDKTDNNKKNLCYNDNDLHKLKLYLENRDINSFLSLLGKISRSYGMTKLSKECFRNRESLYRNFIKDAKPKFITILDIFNSLGLKLTIKS
ncbi:MAG: putative addiction module antidote protein [Deltaproteobacteria bacterium]|jgi:probable addiction module antidote protein|nr:putative addiction module antidote protein [Deltaproteobacteria bacterium]